MPQDTEAITVKLLVNGTEVDNPGIISLVVTQAINAVSSAELMITDGDVASREFKASNNPDFAPGNEIEIEVGQSSATEPIFKGIIVRQNVRVTREGISSLCLEAKHAAVKMTHVRRSRHHIDQTDSEIVEELIGEYGLTADVDSGMDVQHEKMVQYNVSDWDFMLTRCESNGQFVYTLEDKVTVAPPKVDAGSGLPVTLGDNVWEFEAEVDSREQFGAGQAISWDHIGQALETGTAAEAADIEDAGSQAQADLAGTLGDGEFTLRHPGPLTEPELTKWGSSKMLRSRLSKIRGRVKVQGDLQYVPGATLVLDGFSDVFNGAVFLSSVRHQLFKGKWISDLQIGIDPEVLMQFYRDMVDVPVSGIVAPMPGLQIGTVKEVEEDPQGQFRVLVKMPVIDDEEDGIWARVMHPGAGAGHTVFFQPKVDDEVVLGFLGEDPRFPIVLGSLHNNDQNAPAIEDNDAYTQSGIVTVEGLKLIFNDEDKSVTIETPAGKKITADENEDAILLEDDHGNTITMNADGITLETAGDLVLKATGDVNIEGLNISQAAQAQFTAEGSAGIEVSSSAVAVLKGSLVQIN